MDDAQVQAILRRFRDEQVHIDRDMPDLELHEPSVLPKSLATLRGNVPRRSRDGRRVAEVQRTGRYPKCWSVLDVKHRILR